MILGINGIIAGRGSNCGYADTDVCAFITTAGITNTTQKNAINQLVLDLKSANIWSKMEAIYPFVGSTALTHKYNLKNPNLYNLDFFGGGTHSSNGYQLDGATSYANTNLPDSFPLNDFHFSMYSRTNQASEKWDFGAANDITATAIGAKVAFTEFWAYIQGTSQVANAPNSNTQGYYIATRYLNGIDIALYKNNTQVFNGGKTITGNTNLNYYIGGLNINNGTPILGSSKELALVSIGYGLNSTQATAFYNAVQKFNTTLSRQVGVPIVADSDAQAFLNAAVITDTTQANAINTLVSDLKSANIWTKMKAIYPFVGGTASQHRFNLKDPRTVSAAFYIDFAGGVTHSSNGVQFDGATGYADTKLIPNTDISAINNMHYSVYFRNNFTNTNAAFGIYESGSAVAYALPKTGSGNFVSVLGIESVSNSFANTSTSGNYIVSRTSATSLKTYKNSVLGNLNTSNNGTGRYPIYSFSFGSLRNGVSSWGNHFNGEHCFASIGDGLSDSEATAFYNAVQTFNTTLSRQV